MGDPLKVGVNLLWCRPGRVGGAEEYLTRQLEGIAIVAPEIRGRLAVPPGFVTAHPSLAERFEILTGPPWTTHRVGRLIEEVRWLPARLAGEDIVHHGLASIPMRSPSPVVLTIHDLQYIALPQHFSPARLAYLRFAVPRSARRASVIAVPSEFVRHTVVRAFNVDPARVRVVPHGIRLQQKERNIDEERLRARYGLGNRRVLVYPAVTYPHKQHRFLVELLAGPLAGEDFVLLLIGGPGRAERAVSAAINVHGVGDRVIRPGRVPGADRDGLISIADALLFPSNYEGFGAPVIEAMALGTPVICSDQGALQEVVGNAAIVLPLHLGAWADAVKRIAAEGSTLAARGYARVEVFTIEASGKALSDAYRLAAGDKTG